MQDGGSETEPNKDGRGDLLGIIAEVALATVLIAVSCARLTARARCIADNRGSRHNFLQQGHMHTGNRSRTRWAYSAKMSAAVFFKHDFDALAFERFHTIVALVALQTVRALVEC